jgi:hypothetical protein
MQTIRMRSSTNDKDVTMARRKIRRQFIYSDAHMLTGGRRTKGIVMVDKKKKKKRNDL